MGPHSKGKSYVLVLGQPRVEAMQVIEAASRMAGQVVLHDDEVGDEARWTRDGRSPDAVVLDMSDPAAAKRAIEVRMAFMHTNVPIVGVSDRVGDLVFEEAFSSGFDDVCALDEHPLGRRLRRLATSEPAAIERSDQTVVVADPDRVTRMLIGRVFRDAGYRVEFASEAAAVLGRSLNDKVRVVIVSAQLEAPERDGQSLCLRALRAGSRAAFIVNTPPREIPLVYARLPGTERRVAVHDAFASPATLLFVANELLNRPLVDARASERLLYGATVRFRHAGRDDEDHGYLYNVSGGGLYVRTLAPPERGDEVWLEFVPPRCDRRVHLEGAVAWARGFGPGRAATVPCGFGVKIEGGSDKDLARYAQGYQSFLAERARLRNSVLPSLPPEACFSGAAGSAV